MNLVEKIKKNIPEPVIAVSVFVAAVGIMVGVNYCLNKSWKKNLAPNAIYLGSHNHVYMGDGLSIHQENIDKDPRKESILKFYDKDGKEQMVEIYWDENHYPKLGFQEEKTLDVIAGEDIDKIEGNVKRFPPGLLKLKKKELNAIPKSGEKYSGKEYIKNKYSRFRVPYTKK